MLSEGAAVEGFEQLSKVAQELGMALTVRCGLFELRWHSRSELVFSAETLNSIKSFLDGVFVCKERLAKK